MRYNWKQGQLFDPEGGFPIASVWIARGNISEYIRSIIVSLIFLRLEYLMLIKIRKPKSSLLPFFDFFGNEFNSTNFEGLGEILSQPNSSTCHV